MGVKVLRVGEWATLYYGDWRQCVHHLKALHPDACITDPPYGIGIHNAGRKRRPSSGFAKAHNNANLRGSPRLVGDEMPRDISDVFDLAPRTIVWGADHLRRYLPEKGRFVVWDKLGGKEPFGDSFSDAEFAFDTKKGRTEIFRQLWKGSCTSGASVEDSKRYHPTGKSIQLMEWCIQLAGVPRGGLVVDPYMGSATTAIACYRNGIRFVGCEIDPKWFRAAVKRLHVQCPLGRSDMLFY